MLIMCSSKGIKKGFFEHYFVWRHTWKRGAHHHWIHRNSLQTDSNDKTLRVMNLLNNDDIRIPNTVCRTYYLLQIYNRKIKLCTRYPNNNLVVKVRASNQKRQQTMLELGLGYVWWLCSDLAINHGAFSRLLHNKCQLLIVSRPYVYF